MIPREVRKTRRRSVIVHPELESDNLKQIEGKCHAWVQCLSCGITPIPGFKLFSLQLTLFLKYLRYWIPDPANQVSLYSTTVRNQQIDTGPEWRIFIATVGKMSTY